MEIGLEERLDGLSSIELKEIIEQSISIFKSIKSVDYIGSNHERMRSFILEHTGEDIGEY